MDELRKLTNIISFEIDDDALLKSDEAVDAFKAQVLECREMLGEWGEEGRVSAEIVAEGAEAAGSSVREFGREAKEAARVAGREFDETARSLRSVGAEGMQSLGMIQRGFRAIVATGFAGWIGGAAAGLETARIRMQFWAREGTEEYAALNAAIRETIAFSRGIHREGELLQAAHQAAALSMNVGLVAEMMQGAAVVAAARGKDIGSVMYGIGRAIEIGSIDALLDLGIVNREELNAMRDAFGATFREWDTARRELFVLGKVQEYAASKMAVYSEYTKTAGAEVAAFKGAVGDFAETMGGPLLAPLTGTLRAMTDFMDAARRDPGKAWIIQLTGISGALITAALGWAALRSAGLWAWGALKPVLAAVGGFFAGISPWVTVLAAPLWKILLLLGGAVLAVDDLWSAIRGGDSVMKDAWGWFKGLVGGVVDWTYARFDELRRPGDGAGIARELDTGEYDVDDGGMASLQRRYSPEASPVLPSPIMAGAGGLAISPTYTINVNAPSGDAPAIADTIKRTLDREWETRMNSHYRGLARKRRRVTAQ